MKSNRAIIILALSTILIGALLIAFPANATKWLVMAIGALFLVPGIVGVATYVIQRRRQANANEPQPADDKKTKEKKGKNIFPFIGIGSILFGAVLLIIPGNFQNALLYILGAFLVLAGLAQIYRFLQLRKQYQLSALPYIVSALVSVAGIVVIVLNHNGGTLPTKAGTTDSPAYWPSMIFGIASVIFGISEIIYAIQFRKEGEKPAKPEPTHNPSQGEEEKPAKPEPTHNPSQGEEEKPAEPEKPEEPEKPIEPEKTEESIKLAETKPAKTAEPEHAPSFQVPEYTTTNNASYATSAPQPQTPNPTIEAEVDSET